MEHMRRPTSRKHRRKRRGGAGKFFALFAVVLCLGAAGLGAFLAAPTIAQWLAPVPVAVQPQGTIKALVARTAQGEFNADTPEALATQLDALVSFASQRGFNAIVVEAAAADAQAQKGYSIFFRDRTLSTFSALTTQDTWLRKADPLKLLCQRAAQDNIAVYALMPQDSQEAAALAKPLSRLAMRYAIAGIYVPAQAHLQGIGDAPPQALFYADAPVWEDPTALFLKTVESDFSGVALADYKQAQAAPEMLSVLLSTLDTTVAQPQWKQYTPEKALTITYPAENAKITTRQCFVMGTSNPEIPLTLNGAPVERPTSTGLFGVLVDLEEGENALEFSQNGEAVSFTINKPKPSSTGSGSGSSSAGTARDNTKEVPQGSYVQTTGWITSLLTDPADDSSIAQTVRAGSVGRVVACVETKRSGKITWAYELTSGAYVLAYNTKYLGDEAILQLTGAAASPIDTGERLVFSGNAQPIIYANREENTLVLDLYDATLPADFAITGSTMVQQTAIEQKEGFTRLTLTFASRLYGFDLLFENGAPVLVLKRTPVISEVPGKPLQGVRVLLDAGHGANDSGAMGTAGQSAPLEKDVNLAVTLAAKYRLEQMGATVETVRTDDSFLTLIERLQLISTLQPDYFIAIHHNSVALTVDANTAAGVEAYYFYEAGQTLAQQMTDSISKHTSRNARGAKWGYYYVTRNTLCPAVLLETGFMVNPAEYESVTSRQNIWSTGDAIAMSILACTQGEVA